jgi:hypothetical protein
MASKGFMVDIDLFLFYNLYNWTGQSELKSPHEPCKLVISKPSIKWGLLLSFMYPELAGSHAAHGLAPQSEVAFMQFISRVLQAKENYEIILEII